MPTRIYQNTSLSVATEITLDERARHHVAHVLRAKPGDELIIFNGRGGEYQSVITAVSKKSVSVKLLHFHDQHKESPINITLAQGIARGEKMDFIIQKAVELGVHQIIPIVTARCNVRLNVERETKRIKHWEMIVISACEQCGRNQLPSIFPPISFEAWLRSVKGDHTYFLSPHHKMIFPGEKKDQGTTTVTLLIGPEGGLTDDEVRAALNHGLKAIQLGPRILRTETASIAALAIMQFVYGDFL